MFISDLKESMSNVELAAKVVDLGEVRNVNTRFGPNKVCDITLEDDTGRVKLTLWGDDIEKLKAGNTVNITGGFVKSWQGELQVAVTRNGTMTVEGEGAEEVPAADAEAPQTEEVAEEAPAAEEAPKTEEVAEEKIGA